MEPGGQLRILYSLLLILLSHLKVTDAAAAVSFQFRQQYSSVQSEVNNFASQLTTDLRTKYNFSSEHISTIQVSTGNNGNVLINFNLNINTRDGAEVANRDRLEYDLSRERYVFLYTNGTGARAAFLVDGASASVTPTFWDYWHQYGLEIFIAILVGLLGIAVFLAAVYCILTRNRRHKQAAAESSSNGLDNPAFVTEMTEMYMTPNSEATPIPRRANQTATSISAPEPAPSPKAINSATHPTTININDSAIRTGTQLDGATASNSNSASAPSNGRSKLRPSVTTSDSPTLESIKKEGKAASSWSKSSQLKPPKSPKPGNKSPGITSSVRSWSNIKGGSVSGTPPSSRRPSRTEPTIYERLLYASYSVPPKKAFEFI